MFIGRGSGSVRADVLSGITVALALVPEAVAFAFVAGVSPVVGLYGALIMGFVTSVFGGRPGMISGATGALAVVMVGLVSQGNSLTELGVVSDTPTGMGLQYLLASLVLAGSFQIVAGVCRLGTFVRMIPSSVMMGFVNGLAIVIFWSQLGMFKEKGQWLEGRALWTMLGLTFLTMGIMVLLPKITKKVPGALLAIVVVSVIAIVGEVATPTVASFIKARGGESIAAGLPTFAVPLIAFNLQTLSFILPFSAIFAAIGLIESLMTLNLVDELTETRGNANRECVAQGSAMILNGFFGGMGGCAMIGQSIINIKSGGRGRLSGIVASLALLGFILYGSAYIEMIPIAALVGVMFMVVIGTFAWNTFRILNKVPIADVGVVVAVTGLTVVFDLAVAVLSGVIISALVFAWQNAVRIRARKHIDANGTKHYAIYGPLFFGSTTLFQTKFDVANDPDKVIIDFAESRIVDQSAIEAINKLTEKYQKVGKEVHLRYLSPDCIKLIRRAEKVCDLNVLSDPGYFVAISNYREVLNKALGSDALTLDDAHIEAIAREGQELHRQTSAAIPKNTIRP